MNCFPCFSSQKSRKSPSKNENSDNHNNDDDHNEFRPPVAAATTTKQHEEIEEAPPVKTFNFRELASATKNFRQECLIREGGFGRVYRGTLQSTGQLVAVKQLDKHGLHGAKEFQAEILALSKLQHPNLVKLIGYCADGDQRLLVFEFISGGSVQDHLHELTPSQKPMDWITRMKIAYGAAQGLDYLHDKVNPPVLYKDLKASCILLDDKFQPKLCDFGLKTVDPGTADSLFFSSRVMDTYGYSAPEYTRGDELTVKSDVYSFGVVLLELITGRRAIDTTKPNDEQNLVAWAQPIFRDPKRYPDMADPLLRKNFSERGLNQAVAITSMCVQEEPTARPLISDVMVALSFLSMSTEDGIPTAIPILSFRDKSMSIALSRHDSSSVTPFSALPSTKQDQEDDKSSSSSSSSSSDSEDDEEKKRKTSKVMSKKKEEEEESEMESESESESESEPEKDQEEESSHVEKPRNSSSSNESETEIRRSNDDGNDNAQSLKIKYSYSSETEEEEEEEEEEKEEEEEEEEQEEEEEEEEEERLSSKSSKSSHEYTEENTFSLSLTDREQEEVEEEEEIQLEKIKSSKSEAQSVYSDHESEEEE